MLKGKKKALAAQVLLGLMVAGNAYAADITIKGDGRAQSDVGGSVYYVDNYNKHIDPSVNDNWYLHGDKENAIIRDQNIITGKSIQVDAGGQDFVIWDGSGGIKESSITIGSGDFGDGNPDNKRNILGTIKVAKDLTKSSNNTIILQRIGVQDGENAAFVMAGDTDTIKLYPYSTDDSDGNVYTSNPPVNVPARPSTALSLQAGNLEVMKSDIGVRNVKLADTLKINLGDAFTVNGKLEAKKVDAAGATLTVNGAGSTVTDNCSIGDLIIAGSGTLTVGTLSDYDKIDVSGFTGEGSALVVENGTIDASKVNLGAHGTKHEVNASPLFEKDYTLGVSANKITNVGTVTGVRENSKSYVETQMATLAMVASGADLLANAGFTNAAQAVQDAKDSGDSGRSMVPYAAANYGSMRQESGSHVDVKGSNFNIGFAKEVKNGSGKLLFGPMFEYGRGNYDSYLDDGTTGSGTAQNYGIGMMARQTNDNGFYYEGSVRYGKVTSDYSSSNVWAGHDVSYDNSAKYWGAHVGVGKLQKLGGDNAIDLYGKLFYTNQGSSSVNINGDTLDFSSVKSKRSRIGFRYIHGTSDVRSVYAGLAWQYEFDGAAHATANGFSTPSPSVKGSSGMLELGVLIAPKASPVSFDLGVSGWAGKQKGYSLNANMLWSF